MYFIHLVIIKMHIEVSTCRGRPAVVVVVVIGIYVLVAFRAFRAIIFFVRVTMAICSLDASVW